MNFIHWNYVYFFLNQVDELMISFLLPNWRYVKRSFGVKWFSYIENTMIVALMMRKKKEANHANNKFIMCVLKHSGRILQRWIYLLMS